MTNLAASLFSIVVGYLAIGLAIGLSQAGLAKLFEPPCKGQVEHILWQPYEKNIVLGAASWIPDLYTHLITGEMSLRDYLLGGYLCIPTASIRIVDSPELDDLLRDPFSSPSKPGSVGLGSSLSAPPPGGARPGTVGTLDDLLQREVTTPGTVSLLPPPGSPKPDLSLESLKLDTTKPGGSLFFPLADDRPSGILSELDNTDLRKPGSLSDQLVQQTTQQQAQETERFVAVEALPGVQLSLPANWVGITAEPLETLEPGSYAQPAWENLRAFTPPDGPLGVGVKVTLMKPPPAEVIKLMQQDLPQWIAWMEDGARPEVEKHGLKMSSYKNVRRETVGQWSGISFTVLLTDPQGSIYRQRYLQIHTLTRIVVLILDYGEISATDFDATLAKVRQSLAVDY
ncbi:MAG: hypothetical protein R3F37_00015 [Candidatus Competibacteraceae bacterium]